MDNDKELNEFNHNEKKPKKIWEYVIIGAIAVALALFTVLVVSVSLY